MYEAFIRSNTNLLIRYSGYLLIFRDQCFKVCVRGKHWDRLVYVKKNGVHGIREGGVKGRQRGRS